MTSSTSSSASGALAAAVAVALALGGCAGAKATSPPLDARSGRTAPRFALLPPHNLTPPGSSVPGKRIASAMELALQQRGIDLASGDAVSKFLRAHRIRDTGGIDAASARAARDELDVDGLLITTVGSYSERPVPRLGISMRLVGATDGAEVLWIDGATLAGDDAPGLLGLGLVRGIDKIQRRAVDRLAGSLADYLAGRGSAAPQCANDGRFEPRISYRAPQLEPGRRYSVAVLPFVNETDRPHAGELVALDFVRQLHALDRFRVVEPGEVREQILSYRLIMEGGVSLEYARTLLTLLRADLVVTGTVRMYSDGDPPEVGFTALALDRETQRILWEATSAGNGLDGVMFFEIGAVRSAGELACRIVRKAAEQFSGGRGRLAIRPEAERPVPSEGTVKQPVPPEAQTGEPVPSEGETEGPAPSAGETGGPSPSEEAAPAQ